MFSALLYSFGNVFGGRNQIYFEKRVLISKERALLLKLHLSSYVFLLLVLQRLSNLAFIDNKPVW